MDDITIKQKSFFLFQRKKRNPPLSAEQMPSMVELLPRPINENPSTEPSYQKIKFSISLGMASLWMLICFYISTPWIHDLAHYVTLIPSIIIISSIALLPSFMYMFLITNYLFDRRKVLFESKETPFVSILIAAYNEEQYIAKTLRAIKKQIYAGQIEVILIDDACLSEKCL